MSRSFQACLDLLRNAIATTWSLVEFGTVASLEATDAIIMLGSSGHSLDSQLCLGGPKTAETSRGLLGRPLICRGFRQLPRYTEASLGMYYAVEDFRVIDDTHSSLTQMDRHPQVQSGLY
ncbi:unnamed protein product [Arctia plantaginis]|uniref:Uncharacterized protein n=1 Tax=Arctia plantaginis TaxID=874455 RepID=A0A8S1A6J5_ARCPL|nr:unnamed protein product [Arctia plantaginis]